MNEYAVLHELYRELLRASALGANNQELRRRALLVFNRGDQDTYVYRNRHAHLEKAVDTIRGYKFYL
jgi:hypothetical protein